MTWKKLNSAVSYWDKPSLMNNKNKLMALSIDRATLNKQIKYGIAREVYKRSGEVNKEGFIDKSKLIIVKSKDLLSWRKVKDLKIKGIKKIISSIKTPFLEFIGLEDPDIYIDKNKRIHLFFTIALRNKKQSNFAIFLGHAEGKDINTLSATKPILTPYIKNGLFQDGFKEISIIPNTNKFYVEVGSGGKNTRIGLASLKNFKNFKFKGVILKPKETNAKWCNGEISPGPIIKYRVKDAKFYIGFINGRNKSRVEKNKTIYGKYKIGLMKVNKSGEIIKLSKKPLISDPASKTVTFASNLIEINKNEAILYAHVNDSFVRAYKINLKKLINFLN